MNHRSHATHGLATLAALVFVSLVSGCARGPETLYGSSRGASLNGTAAFAGLLRAEGHEVRTALRLTSELEAWAEVIIRFAMTPGPPANNEAEWYQQWLDEAPGRNLIYVVRDYDAEAEYWSLVLEELGESGDSERRKQAESSRERAKDWVARLPEKVRKPADAELWFAVDQAGNPPSVGGRLGGEWSEGIDTSLASLPLHECLKAPDSRVLLTADDKPLVVEWEMGDEGRVLGIANGSFLLNLPLVNPARRPLARRVVDWIGSDSRRIAFVDGPSVLGGSAAPPSIWDLLRMISSFRWVAVHLGLVGLLACLARTPRLGRPRPETPSDAERPAAHAEALGSLLARTQSPEVARALLEGYHRWRHQRDMSRVRPPVTAALSPLSNPRHAIAPEGMPTVQRGKLPSESPPVPEDDTDSVRE